MMLSHYFFSIGIFLLVGFLGYTLSRLLIMLPHKKKASSTDKIEKILPGVDCGACGYPGCAGYATALVKGKVALDLCPPGGLQLQEKLAKLLKRPLPAFRPPKVAKIMCGGTLANTRKKYATQSGVMDCNQANTLFGGSKSCEHGCIGLGSCVRACPFDAIDIFPDLEVVINQEKCTGCEACIPACPKNIIHMVPRDTKIYNACSSPDSGKTTKNYCNVGCIGCKMCENACPHQAISVTNHLATFHYSKCMNCNDCAVVCPTQSIQSIIPVNQISQRSKKSIAEFLIQNDKSDLATFLESEQPFSNFSSLLNSSKPSKTQSTSNPVNFSTKVDNVT